MTEFESQMLGSVQRIENACASCKATREEEAKQLHAMQECVYGKGDAPGIKGHVEELGREAGVVKYVLCAAVLGVLAAWADRILGRK